MCQWCRSFSKIVADRRDFVIIHISKNYTRKRIGYIVQISTHPISVNRSKTPLSEQRTSRGNANGLCSPNLIKLTLRFIQSLSQPTYIYSIDDPWRILSPISVMRLSDKYLWSRRKANWLHSANKHVLSLSTEAKPYLSSSYQVEEMQMELIVQT